MQTHYVCIENIKFPFGVEFSRLCLLRLFRSKGIAVKEILLSKEGQKAVVRFRNSYYAEEALVKIDCCLFGKILRPSIGPPPFLLNTRYIVTAKPTHLLFVKLSSFLSTVVLFRKMKNVLSIERISMNGIVAITRSAMDAARIRRWLLGMVAIGDELIVCNFLKTL